MYSNVSEAEKVSLIFALQLFNNYNCFLQLFK